MEIPSKFTIGIILIGVAAVHHCYGYEAEVRSNATSAEFQSTSRGPPPAIERFRRLIPYMTYYVAQNLAYPDNRTPFHTGYLLPAWYLIGDSARRPAQVQSNPPRPLQSTYEYPFRRYKPQSLRNVDPDRLRLLTQQQKQKQLLQLLEEQRAKLIEEQRAKLIEEQRAKLIEEQRAKLIEEQRAKLIEEQRAKLIEEQRAKLIEQRANLIKEQRAKLIEEQRAKLIKERVNLQEEERRAKHMHVFLEEERRGGVKQSRPVVVEQQVVVSLDDPELGIALARAKEQADIDTAAAAAQRQQYDALLQSHNEQELANSIVPTPTVQVTSPKSASKLVHHIAANFKSGKELPSAVSAAHFDLSVKSVLKLLAGLQRTKTVPVTVPVTTKVIAGKEVAPVSVKTKIGVITQTFPAPTVEGSTPGRAGIDYPTYDTIPTTSFSCQTQRYKGFFGDPETNCQVWHYCDLNGGQASFLCPNGTIFSQVGLTCDWWFNVRCSSTAQLYVLNERLYKYILPMKPSFPEDYSGPAVDRYLANKFQEMQQEKKTESETTDDADDATSDDAETGAETPTTQVTLEEDSRENRSEH